MKKPTNKLEAIFQKYNTIEHNEDNYTIGGGLDSSKFASRRHEDAKDDIGKLTLGDATQLFKKATGLETEVVRELLQAAVPNMEWHHAGKLPKSYGGGMKKTYFLNAQEISDCAKNWELNVNNANRTKEQARLAAEKTTAVENIKLSFLEANAKRIIRNPKRPEFFFEMKCEMNGKYGWFESYAHCYPMTEFFTGWEFETEAIYKEFLKIK